MDDTCEKYQAKSSGYPSGWTPCNGTARYLVMYGTKTVVEAFLCAECTNTLHGHWPSALWEHVRTRSIRP